MAPQEQRMFRLQSASGARRRARHSPGWPENRIRWQAGWWGYLTIDYPRMVMILTRCLPTFSAGDCVCGRQSLLWQRWQKYSEVLKVILIGLNWSDLIKKSVSKRKEDLLDSFNENFKHATAHCWYTWKCRKMETKRSNKNSNPQQCETWTVNPIKYRKLLVSFRPWIAQFKSHWVELAALNDAKALPKVCKTGS